MMIETFQSYGCRTGAGETPEHCNNNDDSDDKATQMMMDAVQPWGVQNIFIVNFPKSPQNTADVGFLSIIFSKKVWNILNKSGDSHHRTLSPDNYPSPGSTQSQLQHSRSVIVSDSGQENEMRWLQQIL